MNHDVGSSENLLKVRFENIFGKNFFDRFIQMTCVNPVYTYMTTTHKIGFEKIFTPPPLEVCSEYFSEILYMRKNVFQYSQIGFETIMVIPFQLFSKKWILYLKNGTFPKKVPPQTESHSFQQLCPRTVAFVGQKIKITTNLSTVTVLYGERVDAKKNSKSNFLNS